MTYLQEKTNNQAEIIPGVISDDRMTDRVQVILVITGLGATPVQVPIVVQQAQAEPALVQPQVQHAMAAQPAAHAPVEMVHPRSDLDLPAFMRRRMH